MEAVILIIVGLVIFIAVFIPVLVRNLGQRIKHTNKKENGPSATQRNYRQWKVSGLKSRKGLYIKDKNLCPCGSGLQYKDCCGQ